MRPRCSLSRIDSVRSRSANWLKIRKTSEAPGSVGVPGGLESVLIPKMALRNCSRDPKSGMVLWLALPIFRPSVPGISAEDGSDMQRGSVSTSP